MENRRGKSIAERIEEDITYAESIKNTAQKEVLAHKALGAADIAVEFGLITYKQWENYIRRIFDMI